MDDATGDRFLRNFKVSGKVITSTTLPALPAQGDQHAVHRQQITLEQGCVKDGSLVACDA
jgi:hypothetical protein